MEHTKEDELKTMFRMMKRMKELSLSAEGKRAAAQVLMTRDVPEGEYYPRLLKVLDFLEHAQSEDEFLQKMDIAFPEENGGTDDEKTEQSE